LRFSIDRDKLPDVFKEWVHQVNHNGCQERFGQYVINRYAIQDDSYRPWPKCFYERDVSEAYNLIWLKMGVEDWK